MSQRKQLIIDKKFQLKTTYSIIGMVGIIAAIVIIVISISILVNNRTMGSNNTLISKNNKNIKNINEIQDNIVHFATSPSNKQDESSRIAVKQVVKHHTTNMKQLKAIMNSNEMIMESNAKLVRLNTYLFIAIIVVVFIGGFIMYKQLILKTHRISGPIYVMTAYMKDIINGKTPDMRNLRTKDEFKEFYELFKEMVQNLKEKKKK